jgi:hypothetical protein
MTRTETYVRHRVYVDALDDELWVAEDAEGRLYFPVRPSAGALGIDPDNALDTIKADSRLAPGLEIIRLPSAGGDQPMQCLHSTEYAWWLAMLDPRRFRTLPEERRAEFVRRQRALMQLAEEIMLKRQELHRLPLQRPTSPQAAEEAEAVDGQVSGNARCPHCRRPGHMTLDGTGWHLHAGVEVE